MSDTSWSVNLTDWGPGPSLGPASVPEILERPEDDVSRNCPVLASTNQVPWHSLLCTTLYSSKPGPAPHYVVQGWWVTMLVKAALLHLGYTAVAGGLKVTNWLFSSITMNTTQVAVDCCKHKINFWKLNLIIRVKKESFKDTYERGRNLIFVKITEDWLKLFV